MSGGGSYKGMPPVVGQVVGGLAGATMGYKAMDGVFGAIEPARYASQADADAAYEAWLRDEPSRVPSTETPGDLMNAVAHLGAAVAGGTAAWYLGKNNANKAVLIGAGALGAHHLHERYLEAQVSLHEQLTGIEAQLHDVHVVLSGAEDASPLEATQASADGPGNHVIGAG